MNLWQVWLRLRLTPSRVRSLSVVGVAAVAVVADSKGNVVGSDLMGDLSRSLNDSLDNRGVSHSTNGSEGMDSREHRGSSVGESSENDSGVSLSLPLAVVVAKAMVAKAGVANSSNSRGGGDHRVVDDGKHRWVVDQGGGGSQDCGASGNDSGVSIGIPLDDGMSQGEPVAETVVAQTSVANSSNSRGGDHGVVDHREDRGVVDQRGGGSQDLGVSGKDCGISVPLAIVAMEAIAVVANSDGDSVGSDLMADLSGGHLNGLDNRAAVHGTNRGKGVRRSNHGGSGGIGESRSEKLGVGLGGGRGRGNDCLKNLVLDFQ